jgi:hypothetical protein
MTFAEFREKYGTRTPTLLVNDLMLRTKPMDSGVADLCKEIKEMMLDLESVS